MASGDTREQNYLDIAANGSRADLPSETCCETRTQTLTRQVAERIITEEETRAAADRVLQNEIDEIKNNPDVVDIVATYAALQNYDTSILTDKDIIRVLADETHDDASTYYRWDASDSEFDYIGEVGDYYTKAQADALLATKADQATTYTKTEVDTALSGKQDTLIAGANITIGADGKTISATDTTYSAFTGTDGTAAGAAGLVPAPATTDAGKFLKADGTWDTAGGTGGVTELTSSDYDYPTNNPVTVGAWKLEPGIYHAARGVNVNVTSSEPYRDGILFIVGDKDSSSSYVVILSFPDNANFMKSTQVQISNGNYISGGKVLSIADVVQSTGTATSFVMSQNAVTSMVFADPATQSKIKIGAGTSSNEGTDAIEIGHNAASEGQYTVCLGNSTQANRWGNIAIGSGASAILGLASIAIGTGATSSGKSAIALGTKANAVTQGQFDVSAGTNNEGYNNSNYRLLTGLYDGQSAHDAATYGQLSTAIINGGTTAPTTATVGAVGTLYSAVVSNTAHLYACTAIDDTTDPQNPSYTWTTLV